MPGSIYLSESDVQDELIKAQKKIIEAETVEVEMDGENWSS